MTGSEYYQSLLKDPKWIAKRRKIVERDGHKCTVCGSTHNLEVHHTYYTEGVKPWEYPSDSLLTVCHTHHDQYHREHEIEVRKKEKGKTRKKKAKGILVLKEGFSYRRQRKEERKRKREAKRPKIVPRDQPLYKRQPQEGIQEKIQRELRRLNKDKGAS